MINNKASLKYETLYKMQFEITLFWTNSTATLQCGETKMRYNINQIKPYIYDTNVEDIVSEHYNYGVIFEYTSCIFLFICIKASNKVYNQMHTGTLT